MNEDQKKELINKLSNSRENLKALQHMLKKEQNSLGHELNMAVEAKENIDDILYKLTGDEFYKST